MKKLFNKYCILAFLLSLYCFTAFSQASISGPPCVHPGIPYDYLLSAYYSGTANYQYIVTSGTFSTGGSSASHAGPGVASVTITWSSSGSIEIFSNGGSATYNVTVVPATTGGTITAGNSQNIAYNTTPATITCSASIGGDCTAPNYQYQWQQSPDNGSFSDIAGATSQDFSFSTGQTATTYYRRHVTETVSGETAYSDVASVILIPPDPVLPVVAGSIAPAVQSVNYGTNAAQLSSVGVGGGTYAYSYQWQSSPDNATWSNLPVTTTVYTPPNLTVLTWYRVAVTSNGVTAYSNPSEVFVYPKLVPGTIAPVSVTVPSGGDPGAISCTAPTGGTGTYSYQWEVSTDGSNFSDISGAVLLYYDPGPLSANTWYRLRVGSNGAMVHSDAAQVIIGNTTPDVNFIRVREIHKAGVTDSTTADALVNPDDVAQTTQYFDGLGRKIQTVGMQQSPLQKDIVSINVYDPFDRETYKYLPYTAATSDGNYKASAIADQFPFNASQYPGEQYYYGLVNFEPSPLNRVNSVAAAGMSWAGAGRATQQQYLINTDADSVRIWAIADAAGSLPTASTNYPAGALYKMVSIDEDNKQVVEYKDMSGRTVLKKTMLSNPAGTAHVGWLCTYYVYDISSQLRFVIPPRAVELINTAGAWTVSQGVADELCFRYEYDFRKRMSIKKVPGAGEVGMVYDLRDRLVFTQDSSLRSQGLWLGSLYDGLNRPVMTGMLSYAGTRDQLQLLVTAQTGVASLTTVSSGTVQNQVLNSSPVAGDWQATNSILLDEGFGTSGSGNFSATIVSGGPTSTVQANASPLPAGAPFDPLTITYYDDYSWVTATNSTLSSSLDQTNTGSSSYFITAYNASPAYAVPIVQSINTRGTVTGTMTKVLGSTAQYLYAVNFYDDRNRLIQNQFVNYTGGKDITTTQYDFSGKPLRSLLNHAKNGNVAQNHTVLSKINYDAGFRVKSLWKNIDGAAGDQLIDSMQYDELGQLRAKYLGNNLDSLVYDYNIRGWLTGINKNYVGGTVSHYFGMELGYDKNTSIAGTTSYTNPAFNGNISGTIWKSAGDGVDRKYDFSYDNVNRLTGAAYLDNKNGSWGTAAMDFSVSGLAYDANGNILSMNQKGFKTGAPASPIDQLTYSYQPNSNKLSLVMDGANDANSKLGDFHYNPGSKGSEDYRYDGNGNLTLDNNKGISTISYNYLNLPQQLHVSGKGNILYTYDAAGAKLKKVTMDSLSNHSTTTLYLGSFVYQQTDTITNPGGGADSLQFMSHEEGRARWAYHKYLGGSTAYGWEYDFYEKDHLGNTRMLLSQEKDTAQYIATMEAAYRPTEEALFSNIDATSYPASAVPGGYPTDNTTTPNDSLARVNGSGQKMGPALLLKVMSGDSVVVGVKSFYRSGGTVGGPNTSLSDVLNSLANGLVSVTGGSHGALSDFNNTSGSPVYAALNSFLPANDPATITTPKAYLNWMLLDNQFNYVSGNNQSGALPVGAPDVINPLATTIGLHKSGYLYIWVSNETPGWDVFFDNLSVEMFSGPMVEESHYYPFGLTMAGISDKALKTGYAENKYRYNKGSELQNKEFSDGSGLEMYETSLRSLDPQLGRWWQIDWKKPTEAESPYAAMGNNPILHNDPLGDSSEKPKVTPQPQQQRSVGQGVVNGLKNFGNSLLNAAFPQMGMVDFLNNARSDPKAALNTVANLAYPQQQLVNDGKAFVTGDKQTKAEITTEYALTGLTLAFGSLPKGTSSSETVYRVFGGDAKAEGFSWTPENPNNVSNFRDAAGLPSGGASGATNTGQFVIEGTVRSKNIITQRPAFALDGNAGGLPEYIINPLNVTIKRVSGVNPQF